MMKLAMVLLQAVELLEVVVLHGMRCQSSEAVDNHCASMESAVLESCSISLQLFHDATYQRVLLPVSVAVSYSGSEGTTVGRGATELEASRPEVAVAKAWTGSTIMMKAA